MEKYGVEHVLQNKEIKEKMESTMLERYGVKHAIQNEKFKEKMESTMLEKYGVTCALQSKEVKEKVRNNNLEKYGVEYVSQNEEEMRKIRIKANHTMYKNGRTVSSRQQRYLHKLLGGGIKLSCRYLFFRYSISR